MSFLKLFLINIQNNPIIPAMVKHMLFINSGGVGAVAVVNAANKDQRRIAITPMMVA